jgi:hypothetical protein
MTRVHEQTPETRRCENAIAMLLGAFVVVMKRTREDGECLKAVRGEVVVVAIDGVV